MTFENKIVVGLDDIKAVTLECVPCGARLSMSPDNLQIPNRCPHCQNQWIFGNPVEPQSSSPYITFVTSLKHLRELVGTKAAFKILLEFDDEGK